MALIFDPEEIKDELLAFTVRGISLYCKSKPSLKAIYAIGYDYDTFENRVYLSLNTLEDHQYTMEECAKLPYMQDAIATAEGIREIKFHPGNWRHVAFAEFKPLSEQENAAWKAIIIDDDQPEQVKHWYANHDALANAITEALITYSSDMSLRQLPLLESLYIIAIDHDESFLEAEKRMENLKKELYINRI
jgi:hypothetical protein